MERRPDSWRRPLRCRTCVSCLVGERISGGISRFLTSRASMHARLGSIVCKPASQPFSHNPSLGQRRWRGGLLRTRSSLGLDAFFKVCWPTASALRSASCACRAWTEPLPSDPSAHATIRVANLVPSMPIVHSSSQARAFRKIGAQAPHCALHRSASAHLHALQFVLTMADVPLPTRWVSTSPELYVAARQQLRPKVERCGGCCSGERG